MGASGELKQAMIALVQGLLDSGVEHAVLSPGSRNAPLISAIFNSGITCHSIIDERSAGFVALGIAQRTGRAVALVCTSGTALLNYYPAIAEAYHARVPLLVLSADRPEYLIGNWDGQCIRQDHAFLHHVRAYRNSGEDLSDPRDFHRVVEFVHRQATEPIPGPVHLNIPLEEPLYFEPPSREEYSAPLVRAIDRRSKKIEVPPQLFVDLRNSRRPLFLNGYSGSMQLSSDLRIPVLNDLMSGVHADPAMRNWDAFLTFSGKGKPETPDLVISSGTYFISKALRTFLRNGDEFRHWHIDRFHEVGDPFFSGPFHWQVEPADALPLIEQELMSLKEEYWSQWSDSISGFRTAFFADRDHFTELTVVHRILDHISGNIHLGNSMPVRYASFIDARSGKSYWGNRGTSGIDGTFSTAVGHACISREVEYLLIGDLSFFYDANAMWNSLDHRLQVIVLNNGGGRIFELLKGHDQLGAARRFQTTPHVRTAEYLAADHSWGYRRINNFAGLDEALQEMKNADKPGIWEIFTDADENRNFYRSLQEGFR
ncbi:MAG: 2-succinyl-5-enolpyruvyl-6-hydroxy-3-cyclohexene-1-carboxylic-acid synthase [Flavobacteriales bacterium]|nr:2-succinyl-5-enolpyruvyl-6-hydroxy-3-cyclohexene-1-carboxylic-acid synthase [Flavobacteriales bacterium]